MNRIEIKLKELKAKQQKALLSFITVGDPSLKDTPKFAFALEEAGVDILELGMPFSDPMADGPSIQRANERALAKSCSLKDVLKTVSKIREKSEIPILLMGYYNPVFHHGVDKFCKAAKKAGVDALLIVDLPPEESFELHQACKANDLNLIFLLAPTSTPERIAKVAKLASGFIYFVSMTGVTGASLQGSAQIKKIIPQIKKQTGLPLMIGFGIRDAKAVREMKNLGDGVVVGSVFIDLIEKNTPVQAAKKLKSLAIHLKSALK